MAIDKILEEISKSLKQLVQIEKERLELEKKDSEVGVVQSLGKMIGGIDFEKEGQLRNKLVDEIYKGLGMKEEIELDEADLNK